MYDGQVEFCPTPEKVVQYCTFHLGIIRDVKDPEGRGRVQVEVPGLAGTGSQNWTDWIDVAGTPVGTCNDKGDEGIWWPVQAGQSVFVGFVAGDPYVMWSIPGMPCQTSEDEGTQQVPLEAKIACANDPRDATRIRALKGEAGHTWLMDDRGTKEKMAAIDWTGAGLFMSGSGQKEDAKEDAGSQSQPRKGERRYTNMVPTLSSKKVSELLNGPHVVRLCDLNGQGSISIASDGAGLLTIFTATENGKIGPSILMGTDSGGGIIATAGAAQIWLDGSRGCASFTRNIILEHERIPVEDTITQMLQASAAAFAEFSSGGGSGGAGGSGGTTA